MIRNSDGTPYQLSGIEQYNPNAIEHDLSNLWDEEAIRRGGSPIYYYECMIQNQTMDKQYLEDRGKIYSKFPVQLWSAYEPEASQNHMNQFGIDGLNQAIFHLNYKALLQAIGHPPKLQSRIYTPHLGEDWMIVQRNLSDFQLWGTLRMQLICVKFQETSTTENGQVTKTKPNINII